VLNDEGINIDDLYTHIREHGSLDNFPGGYLEEDGLSVLEKDCDILIPAALESQITMENADRINARLIVEAANGPVTYGADEILNKKDIFVIPDAYANAGGVIVSYFEWTRNITHMRFGRLQRRHQEMHYSIIADALEGLIGNKFDKYRREEILRGAEEIDLVRSGLDDTMRLAYREIRSVIDNNDKVTDMRTAAYVAAIKKIARSYLDVGVY
jgi:glutamate dehydrogenase (NAD(P)+)